MSQIVTKAELDNATWSEEADQLIFDPDLQREMEWFLQADLPEELEGQYVAIYNCQIVAHGNDTEALSREASEKTGAPENKISIQFVIPRKMAVI